jgi:threonine dehydrogenase-like Zn-dependent dehydrogenase
LTAAAIAVEAGAHVVVSDPDASRRAFARRLGAATVDPAARPGAPERLDVVLDALAAGGVPEVLVAIEASGAPAAVRTAIGSVGVGGIVVLVGTAPQGAEVCVDAGSLVSRLATVTGVHDYSGEQLVRAVAFLERSWRTLPLDELVGATHALADVDTALEEAAAGVHVRVGVAPGRRAP